MAVKLINVATQLPQYSRETSEIIPLMDNWLHGQEERFIRKAKKIVEGAKVDKRYSIMHPEEVFSLQSFEERNAIYSREMIVLGEQVLQKALNQAMLLPDFKEAVPLSYRYHDKDEPINGMWFENDTIIELQTTDGAMELYPVNWGPMGYLTRITEVRIYEIAGNNVTVINLSVNDEHNLPKDKIQSNSKRFKQLNTALTYCVTQFHGYNSDYIILR